MAGLKMYWRLIQESDGRMHLDMRWEAANSGLIRGFFVGTQIHRSARCCAQRKARGLCPARLHCNVGVNPRAERQAVPGLQRNAQSAPQMRRRQREQHRPLRLSERLLSPIPS